MQKFELTPEIEAELIKQIKAGSDDALENLFHYYQPLVNNVKCKYYVRGYDRQDWQQDALIECYQAVMAYESSKGRFGSYFKKRLDNHAKTLIRRDQAYRRKTLTQSITFETAIKNGLTPMNQQFSADSKIPMSEYFAELIPKLSDLEKLSLLISIGILQQEEVIKKFQIEQMTIIRARSRLIQKMRKTLFK
ncbi:sigma-70 family RNA polymerase sigma factor [Lactobacillus sp. ESL0684]|uniref:sigma-70 family RNA polymerase sigma factor n=1 Tax=Lactobacillus sp. ESL0684 TaxID=2983213 RepID=UPI0023F6A96C|nr:sigma-70 family RNA polymerase sigma factor [Lactobacillus sp. ESL0684]WEV43280.1 sigma-70 family RNA polymerase sigma factor [Lactobacillus sp. ESL0684]